MDVETYVSADAAIDYINLDSADAIMAKVRELKQVNLRRNIC
jgi:hypothetical protein